MNFFARSAILFLLAVPLVRAADSGPAASAYAPGIGEIMALQQMRHAKLWLAGSRGNWPLAAYELDELREGFADAARLHPVDEGVPIAAMIESLALPRVDELDRAVKAKDGAGFEKSFDALTAACNACHQGARRGFIVIVRPRGAAFANQDFRPGKAPR